MAAPPGRAGDRPHRGLLAAARLLRATGGTLVNPPGAAPFLGLVVAIGGWAVGLNAQGTLVDALALRELVQHGAGRWRAIVQAAPATPPAALAASALLALVVLVGLGGWLRVALSVVRGETLADRTWRLGVGASWRFLTWHAAFVVLLAALAVGIRSLAPVAVPQLVALLRGPTWFEGAIAMLAAAGLTSAVVGLLLYLAGVLVYLPVVAVAEPQVPVYALFARTRRHVQAADPDWTAVRRVAALAIAWWTVRVAVVLALLQAPWTSSPLWSRAASPVLAVVLAGMAAGDGLVLLLALLVLALAYDVPVAAPAGQARGAEPPSPVA